MVLGLLMLVPRPPSKVHLVLWTFYLVLHGLLLVVQYAFLLGVPKGGCPYPGTERDYPWSNMTSPEKKWLFLSQSNQQILDKNLLYADILIYLLLCFQLHHVYTTTTAAGGATNEREGEKDKAQPRIFGLAIWSDCAKILIFKYSFWLTLLLLFLFATLQISLFGWIYLLACFFFLFRGQTILKATRSHRIRWWSALRFLVWLMLLIRVALQIVDCAFTEKASLLYRVLLSGNCNNPIYYGSSQHNDDASNLGLWTDSASFILLSLQIIIMDTKYAEAVKAELIKQDANSTSFAAILKQRISENQKKSIHQRNEELSKLNDRMNKLSEQLNTIEHVLHAQVKIPSHITRRYGRKSLSKALLEAHGIQGVPPPSPTLQSNHLKGHTTNEDEPRSKNEDQDEPSEPWYRNMATFLGSSVEMLIGWLNTNSEDYRYVVKRVRRRERDGVGEGVGPSPKAAEPLHSWGDDRTLEDKIIQQGCVIVEALHLEPSTEDKKEARAVERELIGEAELHVNKFQQLLAALYYCFLAHSEVLVYFLIILNVLLNGSVLSLGFAFLMFSWGLLSYPWPTKKFWIILTFYTMFVILIRYAFQFSNVDTENCDEEDLDKGRCPTQIVGIHYHRKKFYTYVVWDFILLMAVFVHTGLLKEYGLWNQIVNERRNPLAQLLVDFKAFFTHLISSDSSRGARGGRDYYTIMLFFDLLVFVTIVFGASSFGISTVEGDVQVISLITSNSFPMGFVVFLLLQFISMLVDRAIYLRHSIIAKFAFQVFLLLVWHVWLFFVLPAITAQAVWKNIPAWFIYLFKCSYFIISSLQITLDYPVQYVGWFLRDTYNIVSSQLVTVYKNIPLLPELREMIDWVFTDTVLNLFQWLTVQKVWFLIYQVKNRREQEKREIRILGTPPSLLVKILYGTLLVFLFLCLIWGPLFFFSLVTETGSLNPVTSMSIEVSLEGFQPLLTARQLDISNMTDSEYNQLVDNYKNNTPQFASIFSKDNFQKVLISNQPASVWVISPPAREQLVAKVQARFQSGGSLNLLSSWTISRTPISTAAQIHLSGQRSIVLSNNTLQELYCSLNHTDQSCGRISTVLHVDFVLGTMYRRNAALHVHGAIVLVAGIRAFSINLILLKGPSFVHIMMVKDLFPYYIRAPNTGESKGILEENVSCIFSLSSSNSSGSPEWWMLEEVNGTDPAGIELLVFSDRVAPGIFGSFASIGIIALYGTYVLAFGKIIHSYAEGLIFSLIFNEIMCPDVLWQLLEDIYLVRSRRKFDLEEILVGRLFAVIRSPESIIQLTEVAKPKRD